MDRSLKSASSLVRHRNVLTRDERLLRLADEDKWNDGKAVLGLPKVGNRKAAVVKAAKAEGAEGAAATPAAGGAKPAAGAPAAKAAAPAAGGKAAPGAKAAAPAAAAGGAKKK